MCLRTKFERTLSFITTPADQVYKNTTEIRYFESGAISADTVLSVEINRRLKRI